MALLDTADPAARDEVLRDPLRYLRTEPRPRTRANDPRLLERIFLRIRYPLREHRQRTPGLLKHM